MKFSDHKSQRAFTRVEALVVVAVIFVLALVVLPLLAASKKKSSKINCVTELKQVGLAVRIWEGDNNDKYPMNEPVALGGAQELLATGNVAACFQVMFNELVTPRTLVCPLDKLSLSATNFDLPLTRTNISYFLPLNASESDPLAILSGDDNLLQNGKPVSPGRVNLSTSPATWTANRHHGMGNILMGDGSVQTEILIGFKGQPGIALATNFIVIP